MLELGFSENLFKPWESVRELMLFGKNEFRVSVLSEKVVFLNSMMLSDNNVITLVLGDFIFFQWSLINFAILYLYLLMIAGIKLSVV